MLSVLFLIAAQSTDFGVRELGRQPAQQPKARGVSCLTASRGSTFSCSVASITDGDTLRCTDGTRVRIAGIDAPEVSPCRKGRKCVAGDGRASGQSLSNLASGQTLSCRRVGTSYKQAVAFCSSGGVDLSCAQLRAGQAVRRYGAKGRVCR
jgi:endonuclease YncB( thermonuclease family)